MPLRAVLFDLYGTLAYVEDPMSDERASEFLVKHGYEVYPQAWRAAWQYVSFIDYPRFGYRTWEEDLKAVFRELGLRPDGKTLKGLVRLYKGVRWGLHPDAKNAILRAKKLRLKTAIVTTIAKFRYRKALKPVFKSIDLIADGYTFHCEKSNPKIYLKTLEALRVEAYEAVMIGDDVALDILLPKMIGIRAIFLDRTGKAPKENWEKADAAAGDLDEAMDIVASWHV